MLADSYRNGDQCHLMRHVAGKGLHLIFTYTKAFLMFFFWVLKHVRIWDARHGTHIHRQDGTGDLHRHSRTVHTCVVNTTSSCYIDDHTYTWLQRHLETSLRRHRSKASLLFDCHTYTVPTWLPYKVHMVHHDTSSDTDVAPLWPQHQPLLHIQRGHKVVRKIFGVFQAFPEP